MVNGPLSVLGCGLAHAASSVLRRTVRIPGRAYKCSPRRFPAASESVTQEGNTTCGMDFELRTSVILPAGRLDATMCVTEEEEK